MQQLKLDRAVQELCTRGYLMPATLAGLNHDELMLVYRRAEEAK